jgi:hypothetical protein
MRPLSKVEAGGGGLLYLLITCEPFYFDLCMNWKIIE